MTSSVVLVQTSLPLERTPGPISRQGGHLCRPGLGERYFLNFQLPHKLLPTSCGCQGGSTIYCILRLPTRIEKVTPTGPGFARQGGQVAVASPQPCCHTVTFLPIFSSETARAAQISHRCLCRKVVAHSLDSSPAAPPLQRPFSVQLCGRLWIVRKSGTSNLSAVPL